MSNNSHNNNNTRNGTHSHHEYQSLKLDMDETTKISMNININNHNRPLSSTSTSSTTSSSSYTLNTTSPKTPTSNTTPTSPSFISIHSPNTPPITSNNNNNKKQQQRQQQQQPNKIRTRSRSPSKTKSKSKSKLKSKQKTMITPPPSTISDKMDTNNNNNIHNQLSSTKHYSFSQIKNKNKSPRHSKFEQFTSKKSPKSPTNPSWNNISHSNELNETKKKKNKNKKRQKRKHQRHKTTTNLPNIALSRTLPKIKTIKSNKLNKMKKNSNIKTKKKNRSKKPAIYNTSFSARKRLKLQRTSFSEQRSRSNTKNKKNYYYYNNKPDDIFNDKPLSRQPSHKRMEYNNLKKKVNNFDHKKKRYLSPNKKRKKKKKKSLELDIKKTHKPRALSSRMSNKSPPNDNNNDNEISFDGKMEDEDDDNMHFVDYDMDSTPGHSPIDDTEHDLDAFISELKSYEDEHNNIDDDIGNLPSLHSSRSLSNANNNDNVKSLNDKKNNTERNGQKKHCKKSMGKSKKKQFKKLPIIPSGEDKQHRKGKRKNIRKSRTKSPSKHRSSKSRSKSPSSSMSSLLSRQLSTDNVWKYRGKTRSKSPSMGAKLEKTYNRKGARSKISSNDNNRSRSKSQNKKQERGRNGIYHIRKRSKSINNNDDDNKSNNCNDSKKIQRGNRLDSPKNNDILKKLETSKTEKINIKQKRMKKRSSSPSTISEIKKSNKSKHKLQEPINLKKHLKKSKSDKSLIKKGDKKKDKKTNVSSTKTTKTTKTVRKRKRDYNKNGVSNKRKIRNVKDSDYSINHRRDTKSLEITLTYNQIMKPSKTSSPHKRNNNNNKHNVTPSNPIFYTKHSDKFNVKHKKNKRNKKNTAGSIQLTSAQINAFGSLPASPRIWNHDASFGDVIADISNEPQTVNIDRSTSPNGRRRNTFGPNPKKTTKMRMFTMFDGNVNNINLKDIIGDESPIDHGIIHENKLKKKKYRNSMSSISLGALSHYFQYHANHETKSILAHLAGIIMELVGEPNIFSLEFKVRPDVGMAIRRNKLRISPILHRGLVLSFCVHSMPEQLQHNEQNDSEYGSPYGQSPYSQSPYGHDAVFRMQSIHTMDDSLNDLDTNYIGLDIDDWDNNNHHHLIDTDPNTPITPKSPTSPRSPSPSPKDLPESDFGFQSTSDEDDEDEKNNINIHNTDSDGSDTVTLHDDVYIYNSSGSPSPSSQRRKSKSKSKSGIEDDSSTQFVVPYGLKQSLTKTSNTPLSMSPIPPLLTEIDRDKVKEKEKTKNKRIKHIRTGTNDDIPSGHKSTTFSSVDILRGQRHLTQHSDTFDKYDSFTINPISPSFNMEIKENPFNEESIGSNRRFPIRDKSLSDATILSDITYSNPYHDKNHSLIINYNDKEQSIIEDTEHDYNSIDMNDDGMTYLYDDDNDNDHRGNRKDKDDQFTYLHDVPSSEDTVISPESINDTDGYPESDLIVYNEEIPTPQLGYETCTESLNKFNSNHAKSNKYILNMEDQHSSNKLGMKSRDSTKILINGNNNNNNNNNNNKKKSNKPTPLTLFVQQSQTSTTPPHHVILSDHEDNNNNNKHPIIHNEDFDDDDDDDNEHEIRLNPDGKFEKTRKKIEKSGQLKLCNNASSANSIPLGKIEVTTPGNKHTQTLWKKDNKNKTKKRRGKDKKYTNIISDHEHLSPIEDTMRDDLKECDTPIIEIGTNHIDPIHEECKINNNNNNEFPYYRSSDDNDDDENEYKRMPTLQRKYSEKKPHLSYVSKSNHFNKNKSNRIISTTPKYARPVLRSDRTRKKGHRPRAQTCIDGGMFNDLLAHNGLGGFVGTLNEENLYESIIIDNGCLLSPNISMISTEKFTNKNNVGNILKFQRPFNKMVADENGNIFIGTDKYIRYVTYNQNESDNYNYNKKDKSSKSDKYRKFRKQEKLLYELKSNEHLVSLWNQDGNIYFTTMPYALQDYREYNNNCNNNLIEEWSLNLYIVYNNNDRQKSINKHQWIPPSIHDKLQYRKLRTFRWKIRGRFVENFLSMWYDEKYDTLITLAECDRKNEPKLIFLNKRNNRGLNKLKIRKNTFSIYGSDDGDNDHNQLLIRHKPTKSWLCCIPCIDKNDNNDNHKKNECWIQFKLNRENNKITSSKIIKLPPALQKKKWLCYDKYRDCLIGIKRLDIEELLELGFETKIQLFVVPRLTKLLQKNSRNQITKIKNNKNNNIHHSRTRSHSQRGRRRSNNNNRK